VLAFCLLLFESGTFAALLAIQMLQSLAIAMFVGVMISMVLLLIITPAVHFFVTGGSEAGNSVRSTQNGISTLTTPAQEV
jgi:hypothetical protein